MNINYKFTNTNSTLFFRPIFHNNDKGTEILLKYKEIDINSPVIKDFPAIFHYCMSKNSHSLKIQRLLCNYPRLDPNLIIREDTLIEWATLKGRFYLLQNLLSIFPNLKIRNITFSHCLKYKYFYTLKILLKYVFGHGNIIDIKKYCFQSINNLYENENERNKVLLEFKKILKEVNIPSFFPQ